MNKLARSAWRAVVISRPVFWPSTFLVFLLGVTFSGSPITASALIFAGLWAFPYSLWIYAVNDLSDVGSDLANPTKGGISGARVKNGDRELLINLSFIAAVVIILPSIVFAPHPGYLLFAGIALLVPYLYSAKPVRLKERPPLDSLSNGLFVAAVFLGGYFFSGEAGPGTMIARIALGILLVVAGIHAIGALRDYSSDRRARAYTIAVAWGQQGAALFAGLLFLLPLFLVNGLPLEIRMALVLSTAASALLVLNPGEKRSLRLGLGIILVFCAALAYGIVIQSWDPLLAIS